jgi:hypothetical protein
MGEADYLIAAAGEGAPDRLFGCKDAPPKTLGRLV